MYLIPPQSRTWRPGEDGGHVISVLMLHAANLVKGSVTDLFNKSSGVIIIVNSIYVNLK